MEPAGIEEIAGDRVGPLGQRQVGEAHPVAADAGAGARRQIVEEGGHGQHPCPVAALDRNPDVEGGLGIHRLPLELDHQLHPGSVLLHRAPLAVEYLDAADPRVLPAGNGLGIRTVLGLAVEPALLAVDQELLVGRHHLLGRAVAFNATLAQPQRAAAEERHVVHRVRAEKDRSAVVADLANPVDALLLEVAVSHRQRLVHHQDVGVDMGGDREGEAHHHARGVALDRVLDELSELGEGEDVVEPSLHDAAFEAHQRAVEDGVVTPAELRVEGGAELEDGRHHAAHLHRSGGGGGGPGNDLQEGGLAGAVLTDDADRGPRLDREAHVVEGAEIKVAARPPDHPLDAFARRGVDPVPLVYPVDNDGIRQCIQSHDRPKDTTAGKSSWSAHISHQVS